MRVADERADATLELAIVAPVLMLLVVGLVQFGLWYHGRHVAQTAALEAARAAAAEDATGAEGVQRGQKVLQAGLGRAAEDPEVRVEVGPETVTATVKATMRGLLPIPGLTSLSLHAEGVSFRERFRPAGEGT